jgi:hypothetical protein
LGSHLFAVLEGAEPVASRCVDLRDEEDENGKGKNQRQAPEPTLSRRWHYDVDIYECGQSRSDGRGEGSEVVKLKKG